MSRRCVIDRETSNENVVSVPTFHVIHVHSAEEQLEQRLLEAGIRLERRGEELFRTLQNRLGDEHHSYRRELEQVHASVASEVADIHAETSIS